MCKEFYVSVGVSFSSMEGLCGWGGGVGGEVLQIILHFCLYFEWSSAHVCQFHSFALLDQSCVPVSFLFTVGSVMHASFILLHCWISHAYQVHSFALLDQSCMPVSFLCTVGSVPVSFHCTVGSVMHASFIPLHRWINASFIPLPCWISHACQFHSFSPLDQSCMPVSFLCTVGSVS